MSGVNPTDARYAKSQIAVAWSDCSVFRTPSQPSEKVPSRPIDVSMALEGGRSHQLRPLFFAASLLPPAYLVCNVLFVG